jgi:tetratricopeptide (TPR) repeat protein
MTLEAAARDVDAARAYDDVLAMANITPSARVRAGRFFARTGQVKKAGEQADPILKAEPENPAGHYLRGEGLLDAGKLDDARRELLLAVNADQSNAQYLDAQGRAFEASYVATEDGKWQDAAIHAYQQANQIDPQMFNPLAGLGRMYVKRREFEKAAGPLQAAIKLHPDDPDVMYSLGLTAKALQQFKSAVEWMRKSVRIKPLGESYYQLGDLYDKEQVNNEREAIASFQQATALGQQEETKTGKQVPWLTDAWYRLALLWKDTCNAKRPFQEFVSRAPKNSEDSQRAQHWLSFTGASCR